MFFRTRLLCTYIENSIKYICFSLFLFMNKPKNWMWWLNGLGCGGSMVVHQTVKPAVPGSNPASLPPAGTCQFLAGKPAGFYFSRDIIELAFFQN